MGTRVPVIQQDQQQHYPTALRAAGSSYMAAAAASSLHDLNTVETRGSGADIDAISSDVDRDALTDDTLDNGDDSNSVDCIQESFRNSIPIHGVGIDEDRSSLENSTRSSSPPYNILMVDDVLPIEAARARFLQIFVDHFINNHVIEVTDYSNADYHGHDKLSKRKSREVQYEGDPRFVLPLMYVANLYETLVENVNMRLASLSGVREKTIGVALEAAGGLYRRLAKKFPRKGPCSFKRRELATSLETRTRFPELVVQDEKRVRFVVVNGLVIVEKPSNMLLEDAEWFRRLTGRHEVAVCARDYKFYSPRHKYRRVTSQPVSSVSALSAFPSADSSPTPCATGFRPVNEQNQQQSPSRHHMPQISHQSQYHSLAHNQSMQQNQHHQSQFSSVHPCTHCTHIPDITHQHTTPSIAQSIACLQTLSGGQIGGRLHLLPTSPAKFCDECGTPYWRETSKFCSECGTKRPGM